MELYFQGIFNGDVKYILKKDINIDVKNLPYVARVQIGDI